MTPFGEKLRAGMEREKERRVRERTRKRKAARQLYRTYRCEIFSRTTAQRKGER